MNLNKNYLLIASITIFLITSSQIQSKKNIGTTGPVPGSSLVNFFATIIPIDTSATTQLTAKTP